MIPGVKSLTDVNKNPTNKLITFNQQIDTMCEANQSTGTRTSIAYRFIGILLI